MYAQHARFPWHYWVRLAYNDALTQKGTVGTWRFREFARSPLNRELQGFAAQLVHMKDTESNVFDKLSYADYAVAAAFTTIQEAGGPVMLDEFAWGRRDAKAAGDCGSAPQSVPSDYHGHLSKMGLSDQEIVALASIETFSVLRNPSHSKWSEHPRFDNFYYKQLLTSSNSDLPHSGLLLNTPALRGHVEKFAESKADFHNHFKNGLVKLVDYGHDGLQDVESFLNDDPNFKLRFTERVIDY